MLQQYDGKTNHDLVFADTDSPSEGDLSHERCEVTFTRLSTVRIMSHTDRIVNYHPHESLFFFSFFLFLGFQSQCFFHTVTYIQHHGQRRLLGQIIERGGLCQFLFPFSLMWRLLHAGWPAGHSCAELVLIKWLTISGKWSINTYRPMEVFLQEAEWEV